MFRWLTVVVVLIVSSVASAAVVYPPGARVGLEPPAEMEISNQFPGFENPERLASITIRELPAIAYNQAVFDLAKPELKKQGFAENVRQTFKIDGREALLVGGVQTINGQRIRKWIVVAGDDTTTAFIIAQAPEGKDNYSADQIIAALKSVSFRAPLSLPEQVASLPFTLGDLSGFRIVRVSNGNSIVLTEGPKDNNLDGEQPLVVILAAGGAPPDAANREVFARQALTSSQNLKNILPERAEAFRLNGDEWHEIVARATDATTGRQIIIMQTIRFRGSGYIRMLAMVKADNRTGMLTRFLTIIDHVDFKD